MKIYRTKTVEKKYVDHILCDKCNKRIENESHNAYETSWFSMKTGLTHFDGGYGDKYSLDLCQDCSMLLIQLLIDNKFDVKKSEWDF